MPKTPDPASFELKPDARLTHAVVSDRGDATGPLTAAQARRECRRLQEQSNAQHAERLDAGAGTVAGGEFAEPERYDVVELDAETRLRHAGRMARDGATPPLPNATKAMAKIQRAVDAGLGTERVG